MVETQVRATGEWGKPESIHSPREEFDGRAQIKVGA